MVIAQIFQTAVPQPMANIVSSVEMSLASFAELIMLTVAIVIKDAAHFGSLSLLSMSAIVGAAYLYWGWLLKPSTKEYFEGRYGSTALPFTSN
jgi:iron-regulated transporter 1